MKILVCGDWHADLHEEVVYKSFLELGNEVFRFEWYHYFLQNSNIISNFLKKIQNKLILGPLIYKLNKDFCESVIKNRPDVVFVYRGTHIYLKSLLYIKRLLPNVILIGYNNDDPFSRKHSIFLWRLFTLTIRYYDIIFSYREHNIKDYIKIGAKNVYLLRSWFDKSRNYPINNILSNQKRDFNYDVTFTGHYENDGRIEFLEEIVSNGFNLKLFGSGWNEVIYNSTLLKSHYPVSFVWGKEYNEVLCNSKIALCFLSKLNRDTYTRRCFEIPASGTFMLSEYSSDLSGLFEEGVHAEYFRNKQELVSKIRFYLEHEPVRESIAKDGYLKVIADGHDAISRMRYVLDIISNFKKQGR